MLEPVFVVLSNGSLSECLASVLVRWDVRSLKGRTSSFCSLGQLSWWLLLVSSVYVSVIPLLSCCDFVNGRTTRVLVGVFRIVS